MRMVALEDCAWPGDNHESFKQFLAFERFRAGSSCLQGSMWRSVWFRV